MKNFAILCISLLALTSIVESNTTVGYFIRFLNALENEAIYVYDENNWIPQTGLIEFMQTSTYVSSVNGTLAVMVVSNRTGHVWPTAELVIFSEYCTVAIVNQSGVPTLIEYEESISYSSADAYVTDPIWLRFIDLIPTPSNSKLALYPNADVSQLPVFNHVGYLQGTTYKIVSASTSKFLIEDLKWLNETTVSTSFVNGSAYTIYAYNSSQFSFAATYSFDRLISDFTSPPVDEDSTSSTTGYPSSGSLTSVFSFVGTILIFLFFTEY